MKKHVKYFQTSTHKIEDVLKWVSENIPRELGGSSVTPVKELGTNCWKVEWYDND
jgi:hypothetical protein